MVRNGAVSKWLCVVALAWWGSVAHAAPSTLVVIGDSISAAYGLSDSNQGWVSLLADKLRAEGYAIRVINESISGDTTAGGLARLDAILAAHRPHWVLVELGANDGLRGLSPHVIENNLRQIIERIHARGAQAVLLAMRIPPNYGPRYTEAFYAIYPRLAETLRVPWVSFLLQDVALNTDMMQADGLHPNERAQPVILHHVWQHLAPLLK